MAKSCIVASLMTCQNLIVILARLSWSSQHGQIFHGSITSDLSEPYGNLGKILVRSAKSNELSEPYSNLGKILVELLWPNLACNDLSKPYSNLGKILVKSPTPNLGFDYTNVTTIMIMITA